MFKNESRPFPPIGYRDFFTEGLHPVVRIKVNDGFARLACFGRNQHHAVGSPCAVNGRSRSVLEYLHALNVIGVDTCQRARRVRDRATRAGTAYPLAVGGFIPD